MRSILLKATFLAWAAMTLSAVHMVIVSAECHTVGRGICASGGSWFESVTYASLLAPQVFMLALLTLLIAWFTRREISQMTFSYQGSNVLKLIYVTAALTIVISLVGVMNSFL